MRIIRNIIDRRKVWNTLVDYPVYSPPFHDSEMVLAKREINENYDYFLREKEHRLQYLAKYLKPFNVDLRFDRSDLLGLDAWLYRYSGQLIPADGVFSLALHDYEPIWSGTYHGLNVIHDVSIFAGEYIISKNKNVRSDVWYGDGTKRDYDNPGFGQPCLIGLTHFGYQGHHSMLTDISYCCSAAFWRAKNSPPSGDPWNRTGEFVRRLDYLANPNPVEQIPVSQRTIDD